MLWLLFFLIPLGSLIFILAIDNCYLRRRVKKLRGRLIEADEYKDAIAWDYDPIECKEHHFPGDCPLCGAK
jgi:hypothetical protein